jgi:hypothetical protein
MTRPAHPSVPPRRFLKPTFDFTRELREHLAAAMGRVFSRQQALADFAPGPQLGLPLPAFLESFKGAQSCPLFCCDGARACRHAP